MGWASILPSPKLDYLVLTSPLERVGPVIKFVMLLVLLEVKATGTRLVSAYHYPQGELGVPVPGAEASSQARFSIAQHWVCSSLA